MAEKSHAFSSEVPARFERDMGYSESEFFRLLPAAVGEYQYSVDAGQVEISLFGHARRLSLNVSPLPDRCLGAFRIERIDVQFHFVDFTAEQRSNFMRYFDRRFQRGGG